MDDWRSQQLLQQQQQQRMTRNDIGPIHSYHSIRTRPSPYQYQSSSTIPVKTNSNFNTYIPPHLEQRINPLKTVYDPGHQQIMSTRPRSMPYPSHSVCQCTSHMYYPTPHSMYYQSYPIKTKLPSKPIECCTSSTSYQPTISSNSYIPAQQLTPITQEYQTLTNQSQIFPSPPYQGEFNASVPFHPGQSSSVNSLTDALCPSADTTDRQMTPGPPSVGTPRVAQHQYSFPQTPSTPRLPNEQNIDELTAFLQDPMNIYLTDDITSTLFDDIEALADTYLGNSGAGHDQQQSNVDTNFDYDIILNYLCSDDLISTVCRN